MDSKACVMTLKLALTPSLGMQQSWRNSWMLMYANHGFLRSHGSYNTDDGLNVRDYYRVNLAIPLIDGVLTNIHDRFSQKQAKSFALSRIIPAQLGDNTDIADAVQKYSSFLDTYDGIEGEFLHWQVFWKKKKDEASQIDSALTALNHCSPIVTPNIHRLLRILATLPVSTAEAERVFSKLKLTARNMGEEQLVMHSANTFGQNTKCRCCH